MHGAYPSRFGVGPSLAALAVRGSPASAIRTAQSRRPAALLPAADAGGPVPSAGHQRHRRF